MQSAGRGAVVKVMRGPAGEKRSTGSQPDSAQCFGHGCSIFLSLSFLCKMRMIIPFLVGVEGECASDCLGEKCRRDMERIRGSEGH